MSEIDYYLINFKGLQSKNYLNGIRRVSCLQKLEKFIIFESLSRYFAEHDLDKKSDI